MRREWFDLGVPRRAADVRREHDVVHRAERVVGRKVLADEVVEAGARDLAGAERRDERVRVVQQRAGAS